MESIPLKKKSEAGEAELPPIRQEWPIDPLLERVIAQSVVIGSGKDGVVFRLDLTAIHPDEQKTLIEERVFAEGEEPVAAKILKIHSPEHGEHEYRMQKVAEAALANETGVARIPHAGVLRDQEVSKEMASFLRLREVEVDNRAELIVMDYVEGKDLGTILYEYVLEQEGYELDYIRDLTFEQKEQLVGGTLHFERADPEISSEEERANAQALTFDRNERKLLDHLKKSGFSLDPAIFEIIDKTMRILNDHGI
jgi:hypothetical protein